MSMDEKTKKPSEFKKKEDSGAAPVEETSSGKEQPESAEVESAPSPGVVYKRLPSGKLVIE